MKTFDEIANRVPVLRILEAACEAYGFRLQANANTFWYESIKPVVTKHVGFGSPIDDLASSEDYDVVYQHLCNRLGI